jgi:hypothetical protein
MLPFHWKIMGLNGEVFKNAIKTSQVIYSQLQKRQMAEKQQKKNFSRKKRLRSD